MALGFKRAADGDFEVRMMRAALLVAAQALASVQGPGMPSGQGRALASGQGPRMPSGEGGMAGVAQALPLGSGCVAGQVMPCGKAVYWLPEGPKVVS